MCVCVSVFVGLCICACLCVYVCVCKLHTHLHVPHTHLMHSIGVHGILNYRYISHVVCVCVCVGGGGAHHADWRASLPCSPLHLLVRLVDVVPEAGHTAVISQDGMTLMAQRKVTY